jgi:hypothetical protein
LDQHRRNDQPDFASACGIAGGVVVTWGSNSWRKAAREYRRARAGHALIVEVSSENLARLRRLMSDDVSLNAAWHERSDPRNRPTSKATVDAVVFTVRERGRAALKEAAMKERLARCDAAARAEINKQIQKLGGLQT